MHVPIDYTGKAVYMGIDVHKKTYHCVSVCEGEIVKRDTLPACPEKLLSYMNKFFSKATIHYSLALSTYPSG